MYCDNSCLTFWSDFLLSKLFFLLDFHSAPVVFQNVLGKKNAGLQTIIVYDFCRCIHMHVPDFESCEVKVFCDILNHKIYWLRKCYICVVFFSTKDRGDEFLYTGSGGRDLSGNKRTAEQSCDQTLTKMNRALAKNCAAPLCDKSRVKAKDWKSGKPVRVVSMKRTWGKVGSLGLFSQISRFSFGNIFLMTSKMSNIYEILYQERIF